MDFSEAFVERASARADEIESPFQRATASLHIGVARERLGHGDLADQRITEAREVFSGFESERHRWHGLSRVGTALMGIGNLDGARKAFEMAADAAERIPDGVLRDSSLLSILDVHLEGTEIEEAIEMAFSFDPEDQELLYRDAIEKVFKAMVPAERLDRLEELVSRINSPEMKDMGLSAIVRAFMEEEKFYEAVAYAERIAGAWRRAEVRRSLAAAWWEVNENRDDAAEQLLKVRSDIENISMSTDYVVASISLGEELANAGLNQEAQEVFAGARAAVENIRYMERRAKLRVNLLLSEIGAGVTSDLTADFSMVDELLQAPELSAVDRTSGLIAFGSALAEKGRRKEAGAILDRATESAGTIRDNHRRDEFFAAIGIELVNQHRIAAAVEILNSIHSELSRSEAYSSIVEMRLEQSDLDGAQWAASKVENWFVASRAHAAISTAQLNRGNMMAAKDAARQISSLELKREAVKGIALAKLKIAGAEEVLEWLEKQENPWIEVVVLACLAADLGGQ